MTIMDYTFVEVFFQNFKNDSMSSLGIVFKTGISTSTILVHTIDPKIVDWIEHEPKKQF